MSKHNTSHSVLLRLICVISILSAYCQRSLAQRPQGNVDDPAEVFPIMLDVLGMVDEVSSRHALTTHNLMDTPEGSPTNSPALTLEDAIAHAPHALNFLVSHQYKVTELQNQKELFDGSEYDEQQIKTYLHCYKELITPSSYSLERFNEGLKLFPGHLLFHAARIWWYLAYDENIQAQKLLDAADKKYAAFAAWQIASIEVRYALHDIAGLQRFIDFKFFDYEKSYVQAVRQRVKNYVDHFRHPISSRQDISNWYRFDRASPTNDRSGIMLDLGKPYIQRSNRISKMNKIAELHLTIRDIAGLSQSELEYIVSFPLKLAKKEHLSLEELNTEIVTQYGHVLPDYYRQYYILQQAILQKKALSHFPTAVHAQQYVDTAKRIFMIHPEWAAKDSYFMYELMKMARVANDPVTEFIASRYFMTYLTAVTYSDLSFNFSDAQQLQTLYAVGRQNEIDDDFIMDLSYLINLFSVSTGVMYNDRNILSYLLTQVILLPEKFPQFNTSGHPAAMQYDLMSLKFENRWLDIEQYRKYFVYQSLAIAFATLSLIFGYITRQINIQRENQHAVNETLKQKIQFYNKLFHELPVLTLVWHFEDDKLMGVAECPPVYFDPKQQCTVALTLDLLTRAWQRNQKTLPVTLEITTQQQLLVTIPCSHHLEAFHADFAAHWLRDIVHLSSEYKQKTADAQLEEDYKQKCHSLTTAAQSLMPIYEKVVFELDIYRKKADKLQSTNPDPRVARKITSLLTSHTDVVNRKDTIKNILAQADDCLQQATCDDGTIKRAEKLISNILQIRSALLSSQRTIIEKEAEIALFCVKNNVVYVPVDSNARQQSSKVKTRRETPIESSQSESEDESITHTDNLPDTTAPITITESIPSTEHDTAKSIWSKAPIVTQSFSASGPFRLYKKQTTPQTILEGQSAYQNSLINQAQQTVDALETHAKNMVVANDLEFLEHIHSIIDHLSRLSLILHCLNNENMLSNADFVRQINTVRNAMRHHCNQFVFGYYERDTVNDVIHFIRDIKLCLFQPQDRHGHKISPLLRRSQALLNTSLNDRSAEQCLHGLHAEFEFLSRIFKVSQGAYSHQKESTFCGLFAVIGMYAKLLKEQHREVYNSMLINNGLQQPPARLMFYIAKPECHNLIPELVKLNLDEQNRLLDQLPLADLLTLCHEIRNIRGHDLDSSLLEPLYQIDHNVILDPVDPEIIRSVIQCLVKRNGEFTTWLEEALFGLSQQHQTQP